MQYRVFACGMATFKFSFSASTWLPQSGHEMLPTRVQSAHRLLTDVYLQVVSCDFLPDFSVWVCKRGGGVGFFPPNTIVIVLTELNLILSHMLRFERTFTTSFFFLFFFFAVNVTIHSHYPSSTQT